MDDIVDNILIAYSEKHSYDYLLDNILYENKILILNKLLKETTRYIDNNYKLEYYYSLLEFIVNKINEIYCDDNKIDELILKTLEKLTVLNKGQKILIKLDYYRIKLNEYKIEKFMNLASSKGTLLTYIYWRERYKKPETSILRSHIIYSIGNSDDRIYKYLLNNLSTIEKEIFKNTTFMNNVLSSLSSNNIPNKYILKRIKILSKYVNLKIYFNYMILIFSSIELLIKLHNYYYTYHDFETLIIICNNIFSNNHLSLDVGNLINYCNYFRMKNIFKTQEEKITLKIVSSIKYDVHFDTTEYNNIMTTKIIYDNYYKIIDNIYWNMIYDYKNEYLKKILNILISNNLINKYVHTKLKNIRLPILFYTKFCLINDKIVIRINYVLHKLRIISKQKYKISQYNKKIRLFNILYELKTYKPNNKILVLRNGSLDYQYNKQKFNNTKPKYILYNEIKINNLKDFILIENNGNIVYNLPNNIYPNNEIIYRYQIIAEYIEKYDLYLIIDIDIPNMSIIERIELIMDLHKNTKYKKINNIIYYDEYIKLKEEYDNEIKLFINENNNIKWFPKMMCIIENGIYIKDYIKDNYIIKPINGDEQIIIKSNIIEKEYEIIKYMLTQIPIKNKLKWLEIGDKDKNIETYINKFEPEIYIEIDNYNNLDKIKFDYVISNYTLSYNNNNNFWENLNNIVDIGTIFIFNIKEENVDIYINKYKWKIIRKYTFTTENENINLYTWWIIEKIL